MIQKNEFMRTFENELQILALGFEQNFLVKNEFCVRLFLVLILCLGNVHEILYPLATHCDKMGNDYF